MWVPDSQQCHWSSDTVDGSMEAYVDGVSVHGSLKDKFHIGMPGGHVMIRCLFSFAVTHHLLFVFILGHDAQP